MNRLRCCGFSSSRFCLKIESASVILGRYVLRKPAGNNERACRSMQVRRLPVTQSPKSVDSPLVSTGRPRKHDNWQRTCAFLEEPKHDCLRYSFSFFLIVGSTLDSCLLSRVATMTSVMHTEPLEADRPGLP